MGEIENSSSATLPTASGEASMSSSGNLHRQQIHAPPLAAIAPLKKKRNLPGMPDPDADVIALSPNTLLATNRFVCEVCGKGFQRDQNLQLHRRGHNLPWKLKQRNGKEVRKRVYVCPEVTCVHHSPLRALGDLTGVKKHFCRKHGEKKWKCERCSKKYAVLSDWKAHMKTCGSREYRCDCGTVFSRRDSFTTHRAFCDALAEESVRTQRTLPDTMAETQATKAPSPPPPPMTPSTTVLSPGLSMQSSEMPEIPMRLSPPPQTATSLTHMAAAPLAPPPITTASSSTSATSVFATIFTSSAARVEPTSLCLSPSLYLSTNPSNASPLFPSDQYAAAAHPPQPAMSATALLQKAAQMGAAASNHSLLCGLGLAATSSSPSCQDRVKTDVTAGLGLAIHSGGPTTLDLLGLGFNAGGAPTGLSALLTSFGGGFGLNAAATATSYGGGSSSGQGWDGGPDRKFKGPALH